MIKYHLDEITQARIPNGMKKAHRKSLNIIWAAISIVAVLSMIAFTLLPLIYYG